MAETLEHSEACIQQFAQYDTAVVTFWQKYPGACRTCQGWGGQGSSYDPSPAGVSLSPGSMYDFDPCPDCEGNEALPLCALCGQICAEGGARLCACPSDTGIPSAPECFCWEIACGLVDILEVAGAEAHDQDA